MITIPLTRAEKEDIKHNIQTIVELVSFYGLKEFNTAPTITHWENLVLHTPTDTADDGSGKPVQKSRVITLTKYKMAAYIASITGTELPPCPYETEDKPHVLIGGRFHMYMQRLVLRKNEKSSRDEIIKKLSVIQSLIQSKGGLTKPDEEFVRYAEIKTFEKLTEIREYNPADNDIKEKICNELRRTAREIFTITLENNKTKTKKYTDSAKFAFGIPSASSNYNNSRKLYGALGHLMKHVKKLNLTNHKLLEFRKRDAPKVLRAIKEGIYNDEEESKSMLIEGYEVNAIKLSQAVYEFRKLVKEEAMGEIPYAIPFGLSEPGKPRVITKGPPATYYILKSLQKFMHNHMRTLPIFELLGKTVDANMIDRTIKNVRSNQRILSGDYSDATNELESWVTDIITDEIVNCLGIDSDEESLMYKSLTQHIMELRDRGGVHVLKRAPQINGQLMGSILSFLWLCIANATLVRMSKEEGEGITISLENLEAKINGDDCIFAAEPETRNAWESYGMVMGLKPSLGKVFWTNEFCTMNSRMFRPTNDGFIEIPFISLGLLNNTEKSVRLGIKNQIENTNPMKGLETIGVRNQWLMMGCPINLRYAVQKRFIEIHRKLLDLSLLDWFMPEWSGGLGICDVTQEGWILNSTTPMPGNPKSSFDDDGNQVNPLFTQFDNMRNDPEYRKRSRGALYNMLSTWGKQGLTPRPVTSEKLPTNLDIMSVIQNILPIKPREVLTFGEKKEDDDIYDQVFGLAAMAAYLTDETTQLKIQGNLEASINSGMSMIIDTHEVTRVCNGEVLYTFLENEKGEGKKRKKAIENNLGEINMEEWERRVRHNRKVWKNNMKVGCTKLINWNLLQRRTYMKVFKGELVGKGLAALKEAFVGDFAIPKTGPWSFNETNVMDEDLWD